MKVFKYASGLDRIYNNFDKIQGNIEELGYDGDTAKIRAEFEQVYFHLNPELTRLITLRQAKIARPRLSIDGAGPSHAPAIDTPIQGLKLPDLSVPTFSGDSTKWVTFNETFNSLIHNNNSLSNSAKFQYLMLIPPE